MIERLMCRKCGEWLCKLGGKKLPFRAMGKNYKDTCYCCGRRRYVLEYEIEEGENGHRSDVLKQDK